MSDTDAKTPLPQNSPAIERAQRTLIYNIEAAKNATLRRAPREALEYHIDLAYNAVRQLRKASLEPTP